MRYGPHDLPVHEARRAGVRAADALREPAPSSVVVQRGAGERFRPGGQQARRRTDPSGASAASALPHRGQQPRQVGDVRTSHPRFV